MPARVYWVRRVMVLGTAALMVFAIGRLLVGSSDGADSASSNPGAVQAARARSLPSVTSSGPKIQLPKGTAEAAQVQAAEAVGDAAGPAERAVRRPTTWSWRPRRVPRWAAATSCSR